MAEYIAEKRGIKPLEEPAQEADELSQGIENRPIIPFDEVLPDPPLENLLPPPRPLTDFEDRRSFLYVKEELRKFPVHVYWDREKRKFISAYSVPSKEDPTQKKIFVLKEISLSPIQALVFNHLLDQSAQNDEGFSAQSITESLEGKKWDDIEKSRRVAISQALRSISLTLQRPFFKSQKKVVLVRGIAPKADSHLSTLEKQQAPRALYSIKTNNETFTDGTWPEDQSVEKFEDVPER
jgi:hypothetical protein